MLASEMIGVTGTRDTLIGGGEAIVYFETLANLKNAACGYQDDKRHLCIRANFSALASTPLTLPCMPTSPLKACSATCAGPTW